MEYRQVGRTGVKVSSICLGTMAFGGQADEAEASRMYQRSLDVGVNFLDTANVYNQGRSEEILGRLIDGTRDDLVLVSKVGGRTGKGVNDGGTSRRHITREVEASLKRLRTDRLDFLLLHRFDPNTSIDETLSALDDLVRRGLVLYIGASNWAAWQIAKALGISAKENLARFELLEPMYNLAKRQAEVELLPMAISEELGVISFSPLGGGLLTGRYADGQRPDDGRLVENANYKKRYGLAEYYDVADKFVAYAQEAGVSPVTLAVAWVRSHAGVTAPIVGARSLEQLEPSLAAATYALSEDMRAAVTALTPEVPPAHDRREERV